MNTPTDAEVPPLYEPPPAEAEESIRHSLFGEILDWMLAPLLLLWPMSIAITYLVAKSIANQPFDAALEDSVTVLAQQVKEVDGVLSSRLPGSARDILRADDVDSIYFQVTSPTGQIVDGDRELPAPPEDEDHGPSGKVHYRNDLIYGTQVRVAYAWVNLRPLAQGGGDHPHALVQVAETLTKRGQLANEIIKGVILPQFIILPIVLALVWFALARGLSPLAELQHRIRARNPDDLSPIDARQVPEEISPLVRSLNEMLERLSHNITLQKRFIADAAHQMKTPLAGMRMQSELALRLHDAAEVHRSLEQLAKSSESATRLVNQLLALARTENQAQGLTLEEVDLNALALQGVQDWVQPSLAQQIDLGFEQPGHPVVVQGNAMMLREMLSNLIDNALRYTPAGGSVTVRVREDQGRAVLEVEDTGPGIPQAERGQVFERFYRILGSNVPGSGLGLAIVREIVHAHDASIDLFSNPRSHVPKLPGCLFRITFPAPAAEQQEDEQ